MSRILIVDYGTKSFSSDLAKRIAVEYPEHHVEVTEPLNAQLLLERESWDLVVVNASQDRVEALRRTMEFPGTMLGPLDPKSQKVAFLSDIRIKSNGLYDSDEYEKCLEDTRPIITAPWQFEKRKYAMRAVDIALRANYRKKA